MKGWTCLLVMAICALGGLVGCKGDAPLAIETARSDVSAVEESLEKESISTTESSSASTPSMEEDVPNSSIPDEKEETPPPTENDPDEETPSPETPPVQEETFEENGILYVLSGESYLVVGYNGTQDTVKIPSTYNGKSVTGIAARAFFGGTFVRVEIAESVTYIGENAFEYAFYLREVVFSNVEGWVVNGWALPAESLTPSMAAEYLSGRERYCPANADTAENLSAFAWERVEERV